MDKLSKSILQYVINTGSGTSHFCSISEEWDGEAHTSLHDLSDSVKATPDDVRAAVAYLAQKGLVEYRSLNSRAGPIKIAFHLTHPGLHYKEIKSLENRERWKERLFGFASGILVSVVGSLILKLIA